MEAIHDTGNGEGIFLIWGGTVSFWGTGAECRTVHKGCSSHSKCNPVLPCYLQWEKKSQYPVITGFPGGSELKVCACNAGDLGSITGLGRSPGEGNGNPLQYSSLENPMEGGAWWATVHGVAELDRTERLHFHFDPVITGPFFQAGSVQFSRSVVSDSLWPRDLQLSRIPCPSPTPGAYSNSCQVGRQSWIQQGTRTCAISVKHEWYCSLPSSFCWWSFSSTISHPLPPPVSNSCCLSTGCQPLCARCRTVLLYV